MESGMRLMGRNPRWDLLPDSVLANSSLMEDEKDTVSTIDIGTLVAGAIVVKLADHYHQATSHTLQDIKNRPIGHLVIFTDIDKNIRSIYRSYYNIIGIFILLGGLLFALTNNILQRAEQRLKLKIESLFIELRLITKSDAKVKERKIPPNITLRVSPS